MISSATTRPSATYKDLEGSCGKAEGADSEVAAALATCAKAQ